MKIYTKAALALAVALSASTGAQAIGWPANYEGVMLQGFYWDSYDDTKWTVLEANADEYSKYFNLIWVPNSGKCSGDKSMGYMPQYWFTNHNSSFGTEAQLRSMIQTYKAKGTGIIADVVINHRNGVTNWHDFPAEKWNGQTWKIGLEGICSNDEMAYASGQPKPTGAADTGENFDGCRDLDHTNANVQNNCKNYCKFLLDDLGYTGFRYDMVKGYSGQYNKIYNQYSGVKFSVGEYWDGSYDAVAGWIEATGKESAAFDYPCKYQINKAFSTGNMAELCWKANGTTDQPAGLIHFGYAQLAVTFVDNHDTYRDGSKFNGNEVAANAFILFSPGTPCIFLPHYKAHKAEIQRLIDIRKSCGIHNCSKVTVLKATGNCYMAEIEGTKGKAVVKIGSAQDSPNGYSNSDIKASGNDYCVWTKTQVQGGGGQGGGTTTTAPAQLYIMGNLAQGSWKTNVGVTMTKNGDKFVAENVELVADPTETSAFFTLVTALGTTGASTEWDGVINGSDRYGATSNNAPLTVGTASPMKLFAAGVDASSAYSWGIAPGKYTITADFTNMTVTATLTGQGGGGQGGGTTTTGNWVYFDNSVANWTTPYVHYWGAEESSWPGVAMAKAEGNVWKYEVPAGTTGVIFNAGDGDATKTADFTFVAGHLYDQNGDKGVYSGGQGGGQGGGSTTTAPSQLYIMGNLAQGSWKTNVGVTMTKNGDKFVAENVELVADPTETSAFFTLVTALGTTGSDTEWDGVINGSDRYGATSNNAPLTAGTASPMKLFAAGVDASSAYSWGIAPGKYTITADFANMTVTATLTGQGGGGQGGGTTTGNWVYFDNSVANWTTPHIHYWGAEESSWPGVAMSKAEGNIWKYEVPEGTTGLLFNAGDGDATKTGDFAFVAGHLYDQNGDKGVYSGGQGGGGGTTVEMPSALYILGNLEGASWDTTAGVAMTKDGNTFVAKKVKLVAAAPEIDNHVYFTFVTVLGADWDAVNNGGDRYGAPTKDCPVTIDVPAPMKKYTVNVDCSAAESWQLSEGSYDIVADFENMTVLVKAALMGVEDAVADEADAVAPVYYNLQGMKVAEPTTGFYIVVRGSKVTKEYVK